MRFRRFALITLILFIGPAVAVSLWVRVQQRQYDLNRQLIAALVQGNDQQALALVEEGANPNTRYVPTPMPSLPQLLKQLFHRSPPPVNNSPTALLLACGADWKVVDESSLYEKPRPKNPQLLAAMLRHGANANVRGMDDRTPLMLTIENNWHDTLEMLLQYGADVNAKDQNSDTPLIHEIEYDTSPNTVRLLLEHGADVNTPGFGGQTPLIWAASYIDPEIVRLLLEHGAEVNAKDGEGHTALYAVVWSASSSSGSAQRSYRSEVVKTVIRQLLTYGARANAIDKNGDTPLSLAQEGKRPDLVTVLQKTRGRNSGQERRDR